MAFVDVKGVARLNTIELDAHNQAMANVQAQEHHIGTACLDTEQVGRTKRRPADD